ncbi:hypothetical protein [uncultured Sneathiella sp.]|jgi:hypothetical protein|uniref:hypothetical protein n=1 Tax=uncultured Sneathiella sp. TaxID=879315 RepID=UPI0030EC8576|tara:strand:- start:61765 stop:62613 length:849 start_codon:yes stop_codon:yes gene_type:complete
MNDQVLRLLSSKITDIDFRRDLRQQLRASPFLSGAKTGWLDEAIARGFGCKSHAALLESTDRDVREISDVGFRHRMIEFGLAVPENLFRQNVLKLIGCNSDASYSVPLPVSVNEAQERLLEELVMHPGNVLVCGSDPDANCAMLIELIRLSWPNMKPAYILAPEGDHAEWLRGDGAFVSHLHEDEDKQRELFNHVLRIPGLRCVVDGITQATLLQTRSHMRTGISCLVSMALANRKGGIEGAIDFFMQGAKVDSLRFYLSGIVHVEPVDGAVLIIDMKTQQF